MVQKISYMVVALLVLGTPVSEARAQLMEPEHPDDVAGGERWHAQSPDQFFAPQPDMHVADFSWMFIDIPEAREVKAHDVVTIIVSEKAQTTSTSRFNRQRTSTLKAELKEFIRIGPDGNLMTAADNQPTIDSNLQGRFQTIGQLNEQEGMTYRIAAIIVDVLPNGNIVLEARKSIRTNRDVWKYSLTGIARHADITPDNTILSENIANLNIEKEQTGKIFDSTKRPWGTRLYDLFFPF